MKKYKQLTSEQRYQIYGLKQAGLKQSQIAQKVGVDKSTISREFRRNQGLRGWRPKQAQALRDERCGACLNDKQFSSDEWAEVERLIREDLSPEQAANRLEFEGELQISHEAIYQHVYADKRNGGDLYRQLRHVSPRGDRGWLRWCRRYRSDDDLWIAEYRCRWYASDIRCDSFPSLNGTSKAAYFCTTDQPAIAGWSVVGLR
jgi:IS30 family transposase